MSELVVGQKVTVEGEECTVYAIHGGGLWVETPSGERKRVSPDQVDTEEEAGEGEGKGEGEDEGKDQGGDGGPGSEDEGQDKVTDPEAEEEGATGATGEDEGSGGTGGTGEDEGSSEDEQA